MKTWILVANAAEAKLLTSDNLRVGETALVKEFSHPESRKKVSELISDKPGHYKTDANTRGAYSENDQKEIEADHFALELARELKKHWDQHQFKKLLIVTPAHFYGLLKKHLCLGGDLEKIHILKDYTKHNHHDLSEAIKGQLFN